jgi:aspartyl/asparaginyl beta-hydroxylase (cupin superfamily)
MALWVALALVATLVLVIVAALFLYRRALWRPASFPQAMAFSMRTTGWLAGVAYRLKLIPNIREKISPELISCLKSARAADMGEIRDAYVGLPRLPTVAHGMRELGLNSVFEVMDPKLRHKKSPYTHPLQSPPLFIPGVPAKPFYDPNEFELTRRLEAAYPEIRRELEALLASGGQAFRPYAGGHGFVSVGWNNFYFSLFGKENAANVARCPRTAEVLNSIPRQDRTMTMFAALNPRARLEPHTGPANGVLRVHLPLIVPEKCRIKVGGEERTWEEGKVLIFDDSFVHEVQNDSDRVRVVLFLSIWHPCFADEEIPMLEALGDAWRNMPITRLYESFQHRPQKNNLVLEVPRIPSAPRMSA